MASAKTARNSSRGSMVIFFVVASMILGIFRLEDWCLEDDNVRCGRKRKVFESESACAKGSRW